MRNFIKYISLACASIFALSSCNDDEDLLKVNPSDYKAASIITPNDQTTIVLTEDQQDSITTFSWNKAEYGVNVIPKYSLEITTKDDTNFEKSIELTSNSTELEYKSTFKDLNNKVLELGLEANVAHELIYRVVSTIGTQGSELLNSTIQHITITPYPTDLSTTWGVIGDFTGWADGKDVAFWKSDATNVLISYIDITKFKENEEFSEIKFRQNNKWDFDYGDNGADGTLDKGGSNIKINKIGSFRITMNLNDLTYKVEDYTWGLVGDATPNGWAGPDTKLTYDGTIDSWVTNVTLKKGEFKFRLNNDSSYAVNFGGSETEGILKENGDNIKVEAGTYKITANFNKTIYSIEAN